MLNMLFKKMSDQKSTDSGNDDFRYHIKSVIDDRVNKHQRIARELCENPHSPFALREKPFGVHAKKDIA